jgi:hypothetical protein
MTLGRFFFSRTPLAGTSLSWSKLKVAHPI